MPEVPFGLPSSLGGIFTSGVSSIGDRNYDVTIAGIPFMLRSDGQPPYTRPYARQTAQVSKQQLDTAPQAGEQSIADYFWRRSQSSFHCGAGLVYLDGQGPPDDITRSRFARSRGVDVWTPGQLTELNGTFLGKSISGPAVVVSTAVSDVPRIIYASGAVVGYVTRTAGTNTVSLGTFTFSGVSAILSLATDGTRVWAADTNGIWELNASSPGTPVTTQIYAYGSAATNVHITWAKQRLVAGVDGKLFELVDGAGPTMPTAKYSHPSPGWRWTCSAEAPDGILFGGYVGATSEVVKLGITVDSGLPVLNSATVAAAMPAGERVHSMYAYLGALLGIGTSRGVRIGEFDRQSAYLLYGPLTVETPFPVLSLAGWGNYLLCAYTSGCDGKSGLLRVDLGTPIDQSGRYAWAADLEPATESTGVVYGVTVDVGGKTWISVAGQGLWVEDSLSTILPVSQYLETGRIRFSTVESKIYKYATVRGDFGSCVFTGYAQVAGGDFQQRFTVTNRLGDVETYGVVDGTTEWVAMKWVFTGRFEFRSYQIKAIPAAPKQRIVRYVLMCFDDEADRHGVYSGYGGWAEQRITALEALEVIGDEVTVTSLAVGPSLTERGLIEDIQFTQNAAPSMGGRRTGGTLEVQLRLINAV